MPLSRGTAAVGLMTIFGLFLALDIEITKPIPPEMQVDWEGILQPTSQDFIATAGEKWALPARKFDAVDVLKLPLVSENIFTIRQLIETLNFASEDYNKTRTEILNLIS
jgi:hypothetical protein